MPVVTLLGPQHHRPTIAAAMERVGVEGPVAVVTAGWEEREDEIDELSEHLGRSVVNLRLYRRAEHIFQRDPEFLEAYVARRSRLRELRDLYRLRLVRLMETLRNLGTRAGDPELLAAEREEVLEDVRRLDRHQLDRMEAVYEEFRETWRPDERESVALHRMRIEELLGECGALALAGGHVAILINRLRLFGLADMIGERPVFAWSAGAMAVSEYVVVYHDSPPWGPGDPEVLEYALGLCPGVVALPHASKRLRLDDKERVARFARRFAPRNCIVLDDASGLMWGEDGWSLFGDGARRLSPRGEVVHMEKVVEA
jgi:hypothetical protein